MSSRILQEDTMRYFNLITLASIEVNHEWEVHALRVEHNGAVKRPKWYILEDICIMAHPRCYAAHEYASEEEVLAALELGRKSLADTEPKPQPVIDEDTTGDQFFKQIIEEMNYTPFAPHPGFLETINTHDDLIIVPWFLAEVGDHINRHLAIKGNGTRHP